MPQSSSISWIEQLNLISRPLTEVIEYVNSRKIPFLCIDPGARTNGGTGVAIFSANKFPLHIMQINPNKDIIIHYDKVNHVCSQLGHLLREYTSVFAGKYAFIEEPCYFDSFKGQTAARSNSLFKLIFAYGRLWEVCKENGFLPVALPIAIWKGQLTKKAVQRRVERITGVAYTGDTCDAVGMGLYVKGLL